MKKLLWAILATAIIAGANPETCYAKKKKFTKAYKARKTKKCEVTQK